jgi:hypothetical protein
VQCDVMMPFNDFKVCLYYFKKRFNETYYTFLAFHPSRQPPNVPPNVPPTQLPMERQSTMSDVFDDNCENDKYSSINYNRLTSGKFLQQKKNYFFYVSIYSIVNKLKFYSRR